MRLRDPSRISADHLARPGGKRLVALTGVAVVTLSATLVLALPGEPKSAWSELKGAGQTSSVIVPVSAVAAVILLACLRTWSYRSLQYNPGPIQVLALENATADAQADVVQLARLDAHFRQTLSDLRLSSTTPAPGLSASSDFVELLESSSVDAKQPIALIGRMARIVRPTHAYEVRGMLTHREREPSYGAVIEVATLPGRRTIMRTYWRSSWERALERAATAVAAEVIPRSRHSDSGVWARWKGHVLDDQLVDLYQRAERLRAGRRYEESSALFYEAVRHDPANGYFRLALGATQEELALHIDALLTYDSIPVVTQHPSGIRRKIGKQVQAVAGYRRASVLGLGDGLAEQWLVPPKAEFSSRRSRELVVLRGRLAPVLKQIWRHCEADAADLRLLAVTHDREEGIERLLDARPHLEVPSGRRDPDSRVELTQAVRSRNRRLREARLRLLFQLLAEHEIEQTVAMAGVKRCSEAETGLTALCFDLLPVWASTRTRLARDRLIGELERHKAVPNAKPRGRAPGSAQPRRPEVILEGSPNGRRGPLAKRLRESQSFIDHYALARIYALELLLPVDPAAGAAGREVRAQLAEASINALRRAVDVGGGRALAERWDAILGEDPDLAGLRSDPAFQRFESEWLPSAMSVVSRPRTIARLNASRFNVLLCRVCARQLEEVWQARAALEGPLDIAHVMEWLRHDEGAWRLASELAHHHRHWQTRLKVLTEIQRFARHNGGVRLAVGHPRYGDAPLEPPSVKRKAGQETESGNVRIKLLAAALGAPDERRLPGFETWERFLRSLDASGKPLDPKLRRELAENRATAWRTIRLTFDGPFAFEANVDPQLEARITAAVLALDALRPPAAPWRSALVAALDHAGASRSVQSPPGL
jgi:hypothetical protein